MRLIITILFGLTIALSQLNGSIVNTKHNLSITNTAGTIKAQSETEVCVFCHLPHVARPQGKPLWNRNMPASAYTMYDSDYLRRLNYPAQANDLGSANDEPGALSRQCLSCHDGTIAVGAIYKLRGTYLNGSSIPMNGVDGSGMIPSGPTLIGTDLSNQHPVGYEYNPNISINFGVGTRNSELKDPPDSPLKLFDHGGKKYVECASCHDPHLENKKFLRVDSGANHGQNVKNTCMSCHDKTGAVTSTAIHAITTIPYTDSEVSSKYGTTLPSDLFCVNCHTPHNGEGKPYLFRKVEQQTCFQGAGSSVSVTPCHGTGTNGGVDIESVLNKAYAHPVNTIDGVHTDLDVLYGHDESGAEMTDSNGKGGVSFGNNRHAECMDCHNPHKAGKTKHVPDNQWYPDTPSNAVSDVLRNVPGIEPTWPALWTQPTTFKTLESATKEYQICFKCHSYWGLGDSIDGASSFDTTSITPVTLTDVAWEMNINNKSGHPVVIEANNRTGSYAPKALDTRQLLAPWSNHAGTSTMYCSDCHGSDEEMLGDPRGPHGSNLKYMLKGENNYWPVDPNGNLYTTGDIGNSGQNGLFCANCHDLNEPHKNRWRRMTRINIACVQCHVAIPHGSPVSRLMGYSNFPAPYNYNGNSLTMSGFVKNALTSVSRGDASSSSRACRCHGGGRGGRGGSGSYDENPFP